MSSINFFGLGANQLIQNLTGSGLGLFGSSGFGASVQVGAWQGRTFITDSTGANQGPECNNVQYLNSQSGILGQTGSGLNLLNIPNYQATLQIQLTNPTSVHTQNQAFWAYDRVNVNNPPSGVTVALAEIRHPGLTQDASGSGSTTWQFPAGSAVTVPFSSNPGVSGLAPGSASTQHDWYAAFSASPSAVGGKTGAGYFYVEIF